MAEPLLLDLFTLLFVCTLLFVFAAALAAVLMWFISPTGTDADEKWLWDEEVDDRGSF